MASSVANLMSFSKPIIQILSSNPSLTAQILKVSTVVGTFFSQTFIPATITGLSVGVGVVTGHPQIAIAIIAVALTVLTFVGIAFLIGRYSKITKGDPSVVKMAE